MKIVSFSVQGTPEPTHGNGMVPGLAKPENEVK